MKIRWKLLILLLAISLIPLVVSGVVHRRLARGMGDRLSSERREILASHARDTLQRVLDEFNLSVRRDEIIIELSVAVQARAVEARLAGDVPPNRPLLHADDFDQGLNMPADAVASPRHLGEQGPMTMAFSDQAYFVVGGVAESDVQNDMLRLSTMPDEYRTFHERMPDRITWQFTSLASGVHTTYPAHGGYPPDYDPRTREWYTEARDTKGVAWSVIADVTTGQSAFTAAKAVFGPGGEFAGVTAIDVPIIGVLSGLRPPAEWGQAAEAIFAMVGEEGTQYEGAVGILARGSDIGRRLDWRKPVEVELLKSDDPAGLAKLIARARAGKSGIMRMGHRGQDALWAYSALAEADGGFVLVILPYDTIMAPAIQAQRHILANIAKGLHLTGVVMVVVAAGVTLLAARASQAVTKPISQLAEAAEALASGDYDARAIVGSKDEIGELASIFNDMGPKLRDHEKMRRSLALAMEVQQHLLPVGPPNLAGFDLAGKSLYCDETGGDYYDFIDLLDLGPGKVGIAVGDVTGHGIGAALLMASARAVLRSQASRLGDDLNKLFETLNHHLVRDTGDMRFMTLFYGILDSANRTLQWTSGGHDPAIWRRSATGEFDELDNFDIPLGIEEDRVYEVGGPVTMEAGDVIVIGTDGIWEAANASRDMFGKDRLREIIAQQADSSAEEIHSAIVSAVRAFIADSEQEDDITLVVIKAV